MIEKLEEKGAVVSYNDPYVPSIRPTREWSRYVGRTSVAITDNFDLILISTPHDEYRKIDFSKFAVPVVDTRRVASGRNVFQA